LGVVADVRLLDFARRSVRSVWALELLLLIGRQLRGWSTGEAFRLRERPD
jgi:hypothetical protein